MINLLKCGLYNTEFLFAKGIKKSKKRKTKCFEIEFIISADGIGYINNNSFQLKPNTIIVAKPGTYRYSQYNFKCYFVNIEITKDDKYYMLLSQTPDLYFNINQTKYLRVFKDIYELNEKVSDKTTDIFKAYIIELVYYLIEDTAGNLIFNNRSNFKLIDECIAYFEKNYEDKITLNDLAENLNYSPNYIQSRFKKYIGVTPLEFLESYRLEESKKLLLLSNDKILNIANSCGFTSESYFIKKFKAKYGLTPKEFRKQSITNFLH